MRALLIAIATIATLSLGEMAASVGDLGGVASASPVQGTEISVGDLLQATRDVSLDEAVIAAGSKISVSGKRKTGGRVLLDVALADGHVVKGVPLVEIRKSFRPVK